MSAVIGSAGLAGPDTRRVAVIAASALIAGSAVCALVASSDHIPDPVVWAVFGPLVGWSFIATGLYAWRTRLDSRFGLLMTVLGFAWFLAPLSAAENPLVFTVGIVVGSVWGAVLGHVLLSFPSGRLVTRPQRALVLAAYVIVPLAPVPALLFGTSDEVVDCAGDCPENVFLVRPDQSLSEVLLAAGSALVMTLSLLAVWMLAVRWRAAGAPERRSLAPLFVAGATTLLFVVAYAATHIPALLWFSFAAFAVMPFAFLAGLLRADISQSRAVRGLLARLGDLSGHGDLRDALATALGDPALSLAFWMPDQERYVDARGMPVELPVGDAGDAVTEIERDGRRVAAIVHDRGLIDSRETVRAAGAATALLLENERLDAEVRAHVVELRASRARLVEAGDEARRRLERDLHDGAQSRLVALALNLRLARGRMDDGSEVAALIDGSIDELRLSLEELRQLAQGIHPAVLSDRGLEAALRSLAARAPVPVELVAAPSGRLPAAVETAAYFVVSEGLANVAKYANATHATVRVQQVDGRLLVEVSDDGTGGANPAGGSGLRGLSDRVAALDGALEVSSPPGRGTRLRAQLPCT